MSRTEIKISYKAARINSNLTSEIAAAKLGFSLSALLNYESGKTIPNWDKHEKMAELYNMPKEILSPPKN